MSPRPRAAVAAYLEVFILIGVAIGGSGILFGAALGSVGPARGASVSVTGLTVRQGELYAFESLVIHNTGTVTFGWSKVSTAGVSSSATYCYTVYDPLELAIVASTCPTMSPGPGVVSITTQLAPGRALEVELTLSGAAFAMGSSCSVTVTTSAGAQQSLQAVVVPA